MIFPQNIEEKIGFDQLRQLLYQLVLCPLGETYVERIRFSSDFELVGKMLQQTHEFKELLQFDQPFPADNYLDLGSSLHKLKLLGAWLSEEEFFNLLRTLRTTEAMVRYFDQRKGKYTELEKLFAGFSYNATLAKNISSKIDDEGHMRPNASPELAAIHRDISDKEKEVRKRLNSIYKKAMESGWTAESGITIRNERLVIPVLAEHKRHLKGFVHDESATAQTYYIEPTEVFELNNEIRELLIARRREIERILLELTDSFRPHLPELEMYQQKMGIVDFVRAKALLAIQLKAVMPLLQKEPGFRLFDGRHPLLWLHHQKNGKPVVPLSVSLNKDERILVISGPNAGGKSVCMKTIALLQYMLQCGLLIPAESHSVYGLFNDMFSDIGDDQSIENDLSTYSSHLQHMHYFMQHAGKRTFFFIDEFGTGTDPQFGGPIAESVLLELNRRQAFGVITTHYSNLKAFAGNREGLLNASMLFDAERLEPMYILETGKPGSSHAFEIAQRTGFPKHVLDYARSRSGQRQLNVDDLLLDLQQDRVEITRLKEEVETKDRELNKLLAEYKEKSENIQQQRKQIITQAKEEALQIIRTANTGIEQAIRDIRSSKADVAVTKQVREEVKVLTENLVKEIQKEKIPEKKPVATQNISTVIEPGCFVKLTDSGNTGQVIELKKNKAVVAIGSLHSLISLDKLERVATPASERKESLHKPALDMTEKYRGFSTEINIIGERGEDAVRTLRSFLDDAYLLGFKNLRVVHGKGDGILRKLVKEELQRSDMVAGFSEAHVEGGGAGVTLVEMK